MNSLELANEKPIVSIIIPCFNSESYISECIESVIEQDYGNIEIIVVDDGSTDNSAEVISKYKEVSFYKQENSGACAARNYGLSKSNGKYIKFLDSDDFLERKVIKKQVEEAEGLDENTIVYGDYFLYEKNRFLYENTRLDVKEQTALLLINDILTATPLHRKWMLEKVSGFDERFKSGQEWNLHVRLSSEGFIFHHVKGAVYNYRIHDSVDRISNNNKLNDKIRHDFDKISFTENRLGNKGSGNIYSAISLKYWFVGRAAFRIGNKELAKHALYKAKMTTSNYKYFWPRYYRFSYFVFGFNVSEAIFKFIYKYKSNKYKTN